LFRVPVIFGEQMKNIKSAIALTFLLPALVLTGEEAGFVSLFDGQSLNGWILVKRVGHGYAIKNDLLICPADGGGNLFTQKEYSNFVLRFEFRTDPGGNNGVGIRAPLRGEAAYVGMEIQILDDTAPVYKGKLRPAQYHGSIYDVVPARQGFLKKVGEWNQEEITANGRRIAVKLNGTMIVDADLDLIKDADTLKKHPGLARPRGHIGFLGHDTRVDFRNIRLKELP
jgi:3-keto-disaccharide hydrolase